jgi:hypothetical protein
MKTERRKSLTGLAGWQLSQLFVKGVTNLYSPIPGEVMQRFHDLVMDGDEFIGVSPEAKVVHYSAAPYTVGQVFETAAGSVEVAHVYAGHNVMSENIAATMGRVGTGPFPYYATLIRRKA